METRFGCGWRLLWWRSGRRMDRRKSWSEIRVERRRSGDVGWLNFQGDGLSSESLLRAFQFAVQIESESLGGVANWRVRIDWLQLSIKLIDALSQDFPLLK